MRQSCHLLCFLAETDFICCWDRWKGIDRGPMSVVGDITHPQAMVNHQVGALRIEYIMLDEFADSDLAFTIHLVLW